ncbi:hypothetical protein P3T27_007531 [Kitasatospora sp. MAA19]|uniref:hypothetical protein n=1 Tax=unclassified Kitasatospora TaxID=2633591 RepID=UPI002472FC4A|nr:hypothetical protein [Kitasatospora sp. MAA19]MDH6710780.1 hypothetical protein [Kitasatospora sp. MAA19]
MLQHAEDLRGLPTADMLLVGYDIATVYEIGEGSAEYATTPRKGAALQDPRRRAALAELTNKGKASVARALKLLVAADLVYEESGGDVNSRTRYGLAIPRVLPVAEILRCASELGINLSARQRDLTKATAYRRSYAALRDAGVEIPGHRHDAQPPCEGEVRYDNVTALGERRADPQHAGGAVPDGRIDGDPRGVVATTPAPVGEDGSGDVQDLRYPAMDAGPNANQILWEIRQKMADAQEARQAGSGRTTGRSAN